MRLYFREVTKNDFEKIYAWRTHPSVMEKSFNSEKFSFIEHTIYWNERLTNDRTITGRHYSYIVMDSKKEVGLVRIDNKGDVYEVNILIVPELQGRGYGTKTIKLVLDHAKKLKIRRLTAIIKPDNIASHIIFKRNGFKEIGIFYECLL